MLTTPKPFIFELETRIPKAYELMERTTLGQKIRYKRLKKGLTMDCLASQVGVCGETVRNWELSLTTPGADCQNRLKQILEA
jgi:DNA-binding transcriptional regulator YiaG